MAFWNRQPRNIPTDPRLTASDPRGPDAGLDTARRRTTEAEARAVYARIQQRNLEQFKTQYPSIDLQSYEAQPKAQASGTSTGQGPLWGYGWPRGYGAKFPGGMSTPFAGLAINHWQLRQQARDTAF